MSRFEVGEDNGEIGAAQRNTAVGQSAVWFCYCEFDSC